MADVTRELLDLEELLRTAAEIADKTISAVPEQTAIYQAVYERRQKLLGARYFVAEHLLKVSQVHIASEVPRVHGDVGGIVARIGSLDVANTQEFISDVDQIFYHVGTLGYSGTHGAGGGWNEPLQASGTHGPGGGWNEPPQASGTHGAGGGWNNPPQGAVAGGIGTKVE
jgi:hypothetical protein